MTNSWEHVDIFPVIARIIAESFDLTRDFVTHDEIVGSLLSDGEAAPVIAQAQEQSPEPHRAEWIAHNMVAWFGQRITVGESEWDQRFDRKKIDGKWAYRPKTTLGG